MQSNNLSNKMSKSLSFKFPSKSDWYYHYAVLVSGFTVTGYVMVLFTFDFDDWLEALPSNVICYLIITYWQISHFLPLYVKI